MYHNSKHFTPSNPSPVQTNVILSTAPSSAPNSATPNGLRRKQPATKSTTTTLNGGGLVGTPASPITPLIRPNVSNQSATKIQASIRGYLSRKQVVFALTSHRLLPTCCLNFAFCGRSGVCRPSSMRPS